MISGFWVLRRDPRHILSYALYWPTILPVDVYKAGPSCSPDARDSSTNIICLFLIYYLFNNVGFQKLKLTENQITPIMRLCVNL